MISSRGRSASACRASAASVVLFPEPVGPAGDHEAVRQVGQRLHHGRQMELLQPRGVAREDADRRGEAAAGGVDVDAQPAERRDLEPEVDRSSGAHGVELGWVAEQRLHVGRLHPAQRPQLAVDADDRWSALG